MHPSPSSNR
jgi:hypothetical protein